GMGGVGGGFHRAVGGQLLLMRGLAGGDDGFAFSLRLGGGLGLIRLYGGEVRGFFGGDAGLIIRNGGLIGSVLVQLFLMGGVGGGHNGVIGGELLLMGQLARGDDRFAFGFCLGGGLGLVILHGGGVGFFPGGDLGLIGADRGLIIAIRVGKGRDRQHAEHRNGQQGSKQFSSFHHRNLLFSCRSGLGLLVSVYAPGGGNASKKRLPFSRNFRISFYEISQVLHIFLRFCGNKQESRWILRGV